MSGFQKFFFLLRVFFPSWKFFDDAGSLPKLFYQTEGQSDWIEVSQNPKWSWSYLFLNPVGNFNHALDSLIDQLLIEALSSNPETLSASAPYRLVQNWIQKQIRQNHTQIPASRFLFKISIALPTPDDVLISQWHEV
jgi:hypothetical protein